MIFPPFTDFLRRAVVKKNAPCRERAQVNVQIYYRNNEKDNNNNDEQHFIHLR